MSRADNAASAGTVEDEAGTSSVMEPPPSQEQRRWDGTDAQTHALIALSVKRSIISHIRSCKTSREAWDVLCTLYQARNEARVAYLRKQLESEHMNEGDSMDSFLTKIKDLKEQLISTDEV